MLNGAEFEEQRVVGSGNDSQLNRVEQQVRDTANDGESDIIKSSNATPAVYQDRLGEDCKAVGGNDSPRYPGDAKSDGVNNSVDLPLAEQKVNAELEANDSDSDDSEGRALEENGVDQVHAKEEGGNGGGCLSEEDSEVASWSELESETDPSSPFKQAP